MRVDGEKLGMYVSVPFCRAKCSFCNFASGVSNDATIARYLTKLVAEIDGARAAAARVGAVLPESVDTLYFGGGTPSLLMPEQLAEVFAALRRNFAVEAGAEITLEAAPGQIGDAVLEAFQREGGNRVSLGVQSFVDAESAAVGRTHTGESCLAEIARLRAAGVMDIGADLIAGLPYQTRESWEVSLEAVASAELQHVSVYMLEVDEDSRLGREILGGGSRFHAQGVGSDELAAEMYERASEFLPSRGFGQYEISNFAREGFTSRHNRKYWTRAPYLGMGLDAHSMLRRAGGGELRFANAEELVDYEMGVRVALHVIDEEEAFEENVFLGLRMTCGVEASEIVACEGAAQEMCTEGLMEWHEGRYRLTTAGRLISNEVFGRLLEDVVSVA